jgi:hypothetical protein
MLDFRPIGQKFSSVIVPGKEWVEFDIEGVGSYTELPYLLASVLSYAAPTQIAATTAYKWVHEPLSRGADTVKTYTIEQGDAVRAHRFTHAIVNELTLGISRDGVEIGGSGFARALEDAITMTAAPTAVPEKPILPTDIDVFLDATHAGLGTTKLTRALSADITIGDRYEPVWTLNSTLDSFVAVVETVPDVTVELLVEADAQGMALLTTLRAGATHFMRIKATDAANAGVGNPYSFQFDLACKISDVSEFSDEDGIFAITWTNKAVHDSSWGKAIHAEVVNAQTTL